MRRERQSAERSLRKNKSQSNKSIYFEACKKAKRRFDVKRESFYSTKLQNSDSDLRKTYLTINQPVDKQYTKTLKIDEPSEKLTTRFDEYFYGKVKNVYAGIKNSIAGNQNNDIVFLLLKPQDLICPMTEFIPLPLGALKQMIINMPSKTCDLDPIPTRLLKACIDTVLPDLLHIVNLSLVNGLLSQDLNPICSDGIQNFKNRFSFVSYLLTTNSLISF